MLEQFCCKQFTTFRYLYSINLISLHTISPVTLYMCMSVWMPDVGVLLINPLGLDSWYAPINKQRARKIIFENHHHFFTFIYAQKNINKQIWSTETLIIHKFFESHERTEMNCIRVLHQFMIITWKYLTCWHSIPWFSQKKYLIQTNLEWNFAVEVIINLRKKERFFFSLHNSELVRCTCTKLF